MENLNKVVADNLVMYRKGAKLTQAELAEKLNYSDKAVSKWERGESLPDLHILTTLAEIYDISVNDFLTVKRSSKLKSLSLKRTLKNKKVLVTLLSSCLVWIVATICFVLSLLLNICADVSWQLFVFALPVSILVAFIFSCVWGTLMMQAVLLSITMWGAMLSIFVSMPVKNMWLVFIVGVPMQVAIVMGYLLASQLKKIRNHKKENTIENGKVDD